MSFVESSLRRLAIAAAVAIVTAAVVTVEPAQAQAPRPNGYPVTNVNLRAGPGTYYPALLVVPSRAPISILGCLGDYTWCDVIFQGNRGWMRSIYLQGWYRGYYYSLRDYAPRLGYRVVSFDLGGYWDANYRGRPFYGDREQMGRRVALRRRLRPIAARSTTGLRLTAIGSGCRANMSGCRRVSDRAWRPYTVGRWVFTDRYGWMWVSNEPFGWATYHYGRWGFSNRVGWFWVPGNRWAPAWVSWRKSNDYLAWAPLPPAYDEGVSIEINARSVPDYYWQVVPNRDFLSDDLPRRIVRDKNRFNPILRETQPLGNVTINQQQRGREQRRQRHLRRAEDQREGRRPQGREDQGREEGRQGPRRRGRDLPARRRARRPSRWRPPKPKQIEEVAAESKTKQQGGGAPSTDQLLVPPEIKTPPLPEAAQTGAPVRRSVRRRRRYASASAAAREGLRRRLPPRRPPPPAEEQHRLHLRQPRAAPPPPAEEAAPPPPPPPAEEAAPPRRRHHSG